MSDRKNPARRWLRFSLRSLIVMVMFAAVGFAGFYYKFKRAQRRRMAVERLCDFPGFVQYENNLRATTANQQPKAAAGSVDRVRAWLMEQLGVDFFHDVQRICIDGRKQFSDADLTATCRLSKLTSLRLGRTAVTDEGIQPISNLVELEKFSISSPHLTDRAVSHIVRLPKLEYLSLDEVDVTDAGLAKLAVLDKLESISLRNTQVTAEGVAALQSALPNCKITLRQ